jgi:hypothetical protein
MLYRLSSELFHQKKFLVRSIGFCRLTFFLREKIGFAALKFAANLGPSADPGFSRASTAEMPKTPGEGGVGGHSAGHEKLTHECPVERFRPVCLPSPNI